MNIHEYQGKAVLKSFGASVPRGFPAFTTEEAIDAAAKAGRKSVLVEVNGESGSRFITLPVGKG